MKPVFCSKYINSVYKKYNLSFAAEDGRIRDRRKFACYHYCSCITFDINNRTDFNVEHEIISLNGRQYYEHISHIEAHIDTSCLYHQGINLWLCLMSIKVHIVIISMHEIYTKLLWGTYWLSWIYRSYVHKVLVIKFRPPCQIATRSTLANVITSYHCKQSTNKNEAMLFFRIAFIFNKHWL